MERPAVEVCVEEERGGDFRAMTADAGGRRLKA
jgi:hypothetical protein